MYDFAKKITSFHDNHVTLSIALRNDMRAKRDANKDRIISGLEDAERPIPVEWINQGGYAQRTMTQPPEGDEVSRYDIDMGAVFSFEETKTPATTKKWVCDAIAAKAANMKNDPVVKPKCVRVVYADGYQCDFPVFRTAPTRPEGYELAAGDSWIPSDPKSMNKWIDERVSTLSPVGDGAAQLRLIIRLLKYFSKVKSYHKGLKYPSGLLATALAIECYAPTVGRIDHSFRETLRRLSWRSKYSPVFANGCQISDEKDIERIQRLVDSAMSAVEILDSLDDEETDDEKANKVWKKVFRHSFFDHAEYKSASKFSKAAAASIGIGMTEQLARAQSAASDMITRGITSKPFASYSSDHE